MNTVKIDSRNVKIIAHRGLSGLERENTNSAFVAAGNRSYFGIETDVHKTKDGKFVIIHDETTDRVSLGTVNINVEKSNYSDIENIILPDMDETFDRKDIKIPLLREYIKICKKYEKICVLELKNAFEKADIKKIILEFKDADYLENVIFISFVWENCIILRGLLPDAKIQWLTGKSVNPKIAQLLKENKFDIDMKYKHLTKETVDMLHSYSVLVNAWTCDDEQDAKALIEMGVDFITTNILE